MWRSTGSWLKVTFFNYVPESLVFCSYPVHFVVFSYNQESRDGRNIAQALGETIFDDGSNRKNQNILKYFEVKKFFVRKIFSKIPGRIFFEILKIWNFSKIEKSTFHWKSGFSTFSRKFPKKTTPENFKNIFRTNNFLTSKYFQIFWFFLFEPSSKIVSPYVWPIPSTSTHSSLPRITENVTGNCSIPVYLVQS